jgi:hypothetical protein
VSGYRVQELTREEMAATDPFGSRGVFLGAPGRGSGEITGMLAERLGTIVAAVTWDGIGVWVDAEVAGMTALELESRWKGMLGDVNRIVRAGGARRVYRFHNRGDAYLEGDL